MNMSTHSLSTAPEARTVRLRARLLAVFLVAFIVSVVGIALPAQAKAELSGVTCGGTIQMSYEPGLRLYEQDVFVTETDLLTNCVSSNPAIESGIAKFEGTVPLSCLQPFDSFTLDEYTVQWTDELFSTMTVAFTVTTVGGSTTSTMTGVVTEGAFEGGSVTFVYTYAQLDMLQCVLSGVESMTGLISATII